MNRVLVPVIAAIIMSLGIAPFSLRLVIGGDGTIFDSTPNANPPTDPTSAVSPQQAAPPAAPIANDPTAKTCSGVNDKAEKLAKDTVAAAQKVRDDKSKEITDAYQARIDSAYKTLKDQRTKSIAAAIANYDAQISQITKTGDLDKALAVKAMKEAFIKQQTEENDRIANECQAAKGASTPPDHANSFNWIEGTKWGHKNSNRTIITFGPNHAVNCAKWNGTWSVTDSHTLKVLVGEGVHLFTFNTSRDAMMEGDGFIWCLIK